MASCRIQESKKEASRPNNFNFKMSKTLDKWGGGGGGGGGRQENCPPCEPSNQNYGTDLTNAVNGRMA